MEKSHKMAAWKTALPSTGPEWTGGIHGMGSCAVIYLLSSIECFGFSKAPYYRKQLQMSSHLPHHLKTDVSWNYENNDVF